MLGLIVTATGSNGHGAAGKWRIGESGKQRCKRVASLILPRLDSYLFRFS